MFMRLRLAAVILLCCFAAIPAVAQEFGPGILPADTSFFIYSRGTAHAETAYPNNPMIQSWNSPEFADFRQQAIAYLIRHGDWKMNGRPVNFTTAQTEQMFSFLKSPMMLGFAGSIDLGSIANASAPSAKQLMGAGGMFFILDATGKTAQFDLLFKLIEANVSKEISRTRSDVSGVSIEKFAGPNNTSFAARAGNYFIWSNQQKVIQDLVSRLSAHSAPAESLAQSANYQHCRGKSDPDSVSEVYFRIPDLSKLPIPPSDQFDTPAAMRSLKLDSIRAFCGSYGITQDGEHSHGMLVGDTAPGGIFDLLGTNRSHFDTLALAPSSAYSYMSYSFDLPAMYKLVHAVVLAGLPAQQAMMIQMAEGMAAIQIGMPINDALSLVAGEFATIQVDPKATPPSQIFVVSISNPDKVIGLIKKVGADSFEEDSHENGITVFKSKSAAPDTTKTATNAPSAKSTVAKSPAANVVDPPMPSSYLAVTPHFLLYATDKQALRKTALLDAAGAPAAGSSLADNPEISKLRAALPHDLLGLTITDYTRSDWAADLVKSMNDTEKTGSSKLSPEDIQFFDSMKKFGASAIGKIILRRSVGGWWKEADGIHYEGFSQ
jgi:hypothetical protein